MINQVCISIQNLNDLCLLFQITTSAGRKRALIGGCVELTITEYMLRRAKRDIITRFKLGLSEKG
jgi:hypothetical protein